MHVKDNIIIHVSKSEYDIFYLKLEDGEGFDTHGAKQSVLRVRDM